MKKWLWAIGIVVAIAVIGVNIYLLTAEETVSSTAEENIETIVVEEQTLHDRFLASGVVAPVAEQKIYADQSLGEIEEFHVEEGDSVEEGDALVTYINDDSERQIQQLESSLTRFALEMEHQTERKADVEQSIEDVQERLEELEEDDAPKEVTQPLEDQKTSHEAQLKDIEFQMQMSRLEREETEDEIEYIKDELRHTVSSELDGVVQTIDEHPADPTQPGMLVHLVSNEPYQIEGTVSEFDSVHLQEGQAVTVEAKAMPGEEFSGELQQLILTPDEQGTEGMNLGEEEGVTSYPYIVTVDEVSPDVHPGFHVNVSFQVVVDEQALLIPFEAVQQEDDKDVVYVLEEETMHKREVQTGLTNESGIQIINGLQAGDEVILSSEMGMVDGMEVSTHDSAA